MNAVYTSVKPAAILETAAAERSLSIFLRAVRESGLEERLEQQGPFTVFMPVDNAFQDLGEAALNELFDDLVRLAELVERHVVPGRYVGSYFATPAAVATLSGEKLCMDKSKFLEPDIECSNGLIHIIDEVQR